MRRRVVRTEVRCDLCGRDISRPGAGFQAGPLDFCRRCRVPARACQSCGSLPTFPRLVQTWGGNCLACWRAAMTLPRGKCSALGPLGYTGWANKHRCACDQLAHHPDAHHCPGCGENWGLR